MSGCCQNTTTTGDSQEDQNGNPNHLAKGEEDEEEGTTTEAGGILTTNSNFKYYLVICNISKRANVRSLLCTAAAFGCCGVFIVGQKSFNTAGDDDIVILDNNDDDNINIKKQRRSDIPNPIQDYIKRGEMTIQRFAKWKEFIQYIRQDDTTIRLIGVEIHQDAKPIDEYLPTTTTSSSSGEPIAFLMGNEGQGLSERQQDDCDGFVRIPQYGSGTASLNVNVAASIILQRMYEHANTIVF